MINKAEISNQRSPVSYQRSAVSGQQNLQHRNIEDLKGRKDPEALLSAAKELEALFAYEMIKAMRQTTDSTKGGFGQDAYMSLFDTELSRIFADRGLGLKEVLLRGLNRKAAVSSQQSVIGSQPAAVSSHSTAVGRQNTGDRSQEIKSHQLSAVSDQDIRKGVRNIKAGTENTGDSIQKDEILPLAARPMPLISSSMPLAPGPSVSSGPSSSEPNIPVDGPISSQFGMRRHPVYGDNRFHHGMDIAAPEGAQVYPYQRGSVIFSGEQAGYGNTVVIDHGNGYQSKYAHNRINLVKAGDLVAEDTVIAEVGSTGLSTGPHLHFEVKRDGKYLNPARVLAFK